MSVIRVEKNKNYTTMSNYHLKERKMSLKAKGLMSMMLSLPEDWDYSIAGLVAICKENETAIKTTLDELKEFGYLQVIKKMPNETESGRFEYEYVLYEEKQQLEKQGIENLGVEILGVENQTQLNTNNQITDKLNTNNKVSKKESTKLFDEIIDENFENEKVKTELIEFIKMRKQIKKPMTNRALEILIKKLKEMSNNDCDLMVKLLDQSIEHSWQTIYELKDNMTYQKSKDNFIHNKYTTEELNDIFDDLDTVKVV